MSWIDFQDLIQSVADGVMFGTTYALIGIGFTLIFGVMHKINLSYAAASIGAAYLSLLVVKFAPAAPALVVYVSAALLGGVLGLLVYLVCFRFLPLNQPLATLMSTVGMLPLLEEAIVHATAGMPQNYPAMFSGVVFDIGPLMPRGDLLAVFGLGCAAMVGLKLLLQRTKLGLATRAVAQQPVAARLCGMGVDTTNACTFVIAGLLGGTAGAMAGAAIGVLEASRWFQGWRTVVFGGAVALFLRWRPRGLLDETSVHAAARWLQRFSTSKTTTSERNQHAHP